MTKIFKSIALMLFSYVSVFDNEGKLVSMEPLHRNTCELKLSKYVTTPRDVKYLELRVDKRGKDKLKDGVILIDTGDSLVRKSLTGEDLYKPIILTDFEPEPKPNLSDDDWTNKLTFCIDEEWLKANQEYFNNLMLGKE